MKKFLSLLLVCAMALSTLVSVAPVFAVEGNGGSSTVKVGDVFRPDYANGSNDVFKFGYYVSPSFATSPVFDKVSTTTDDAYWPFSDNTANTPYTDFYRYYNDSYNDYCIAGSAEANVIGLYFKDWKSPIVGFVAPDDATYTFDMYLGVQGTGEIDNTKTYLQPYVTDSTGKWTELIQYRGLYANVSSVSSVLNRFTFSLKLEKGDRVDLMAIYNAYGGYGKAFFIKDLTVTASYAPDLVNGSNDLFKFGYYVSPSFATSPVFDKVGTTTDDAYWPFSDGTANTPYTDFYRYYNDSYNDYCIAGSADADMIGLYFKDWKSPIVAFVAPECGSYTFNMYLGTQGSGEIDNSKTYLQPYVTDSTGSWTELNQYKGLYVNVSSVNTVLNQFTFTLDLERGDRVDLMAIYNAYSGYGKPFFIKGLSVAPVFEHGGDAEWTKTETTHKQVYSCCGEAKVAEANHDYVNGKCSVCEYEHVNHEGGSATCTTLKVCTLCGKSYGETLSHTPKDTYEHNTAEHWKICQNCPAEIEGTRAEHNFDNGNCICGEPKPACQHTTCTKTYSNGTESGHVATWSCGDVDTSDTAHNYVDGICSKCNYSHQNHTGGTATCTDKAECEICHTTYGETLEHEPKAEYGKDEDGHWQICKNGCNSEIENSAAPHDFTNGDCVCGQKKPIGTGDVFKPEGLGTSANNGLFGLGYYESGNKTNITVFDQIKTTEADYHWPFMDAFELYAHFNSTVDTLCIASANNANVIGMYNKGEGKVPAVLFTAPVSGVYQFSMELSGCVYGSEATPGVLRAYVSGSSSPRASSEFGRGANGNISYKSFVVTVYLEKDASLALIIEDTPQRPYIIKDLCAILLSVCDECDHTGGSKVYSDVTEDSHVASYSCCGTVITTDTEHDFENGNCVCGQVKPIEDLNVGDTVKPENLGNSAYNGLFGLGCYVTGDKTNITVFDKVKDTEADHHWPFMEAFKFYAYYSSDVDTLCIAGAKNANAIGLYNKGEGKVPAVLFTVPTTGTYKFSMDLSGCVYNGTEELAGILNAYVAGNNTPIASSEFGRGANGNISYKSFTFMVYLEKGDVLSLVFENATTRPYIIKDLNAKLLSLSDGCDHVGEKATGKSNTQHWEECADCGEVVESSIANHKYSKGKCTTCGQVKIGTTYKPTNLGVNANNGAFALGYYSSGSKTNVTVFDKVHTEKADAYWPFQETMDFYAYYGSSFDGNCIAGVKGNNVIGFYNQNNQHVPAILFTAPSAGTYKFSMDLSACVYNGTEELPGRLNVYVEGDDNAYKCLDFARASAPDKIDYKNFVFYVYLEEGQKLSLVFENATTRPYIVKDLTAKYVSVSPTTGDNGISAAVLVVVLCGLGITVAAKKKRGR